LQRIAFLIGSEQQRNPARVRGKCRGKLLERADHGRDAAFHVGRPAPVQPAIAQFGNERIAVPGRARSGRNHVGMTEESQHRTVVAVHSPEVAHWAERQRLDAKSCAGQTRPDQLLTARIFGRQRRAPDQFAGQGKHRTHASINARRRSAA
jgi:hypothetical protein